MLPVSARSMPPINCSITPISTMPPAPRVIAPYAQTLWEAARALGTREAALVGALGRATIGDEDVTVTAYLDMLQAANSACGASFGWRLGQHVKPTTYGVNGILLLACPSLGDALQQVLRFESLVHDLGRSSFILSCGQGIFVWRNDCGAHPAARALTESVFAGIITCAQWLAGKPLIDLELELSQRTDDATAAKIVRWSGATVRWGGEANRLLFPAAVLDWTIPLANKALLPLLQQHAEVLLQARHPRESGVVAQVRQSISGRLGQGAVKLADVADDLHLSTRTLQRRLSEAGVAYQTLLDATRHELARHYLMNSAMPIAEIGFLLGFQDTAAFHHAFKVWQGLGPGQYRATVS